ESGRYSVAFTRSAFHRAGNTPILRYSITPTLPKQENQQSGVIVLLHVSMLLRDNYLCESYLMVLHDIYLNL
ncbi:MAG: hypothetical protein KAU06_04180, partial [Candidatus Marinimicrobia bacterium]|nr:hypothetical protein [Candidatus Neomarinimicrobiota bacterium]